MPIVVPCPICSSRSSSRGGLIDGEPGSRIPELEPVEGKNGLLRCMFGHTYRMYLDPQGLTPGKNVKKNKKKSWWS